MAAASAAENQGRYRDSVVHLTQAVSELRLLISDETAIQDWVSLADCLNRMGWNQAVYLGDYQSARTNLSEAAAIAAAELPSDHLQTIRNFHNAAMLAFYENRLDEALSLNREVLAMREKKPDAKRRTAATLNNMGLIYREKGALRQARLHFERSLRLKVEALGDGDASLASSYQNLGRIYHLQGNYEKARDFLEKAYQLRQDNLGENHPDIASAGYALARVYLETGEVPKAKPIIEKSLSILSKSLGEDHPHWAHSLWEMARVQAIEGDFDRAMEGLAKAKVIFGDHFEPGNYHLAENLQHFAWVFWKKGDFDQSLAYLDRALAVLKERESFGSGTGMVDETRVRCLHGKATVLVSKYLHSNRGSDLEAALDVVVEAARVLALAQRRILTEEAQLNLARRSRRILDFGVNIALALNAQRGDPKSLEWAFLLAEQGKMSVLRQALGEMALLRVAGVPDEELARETELRQRGYQLETQAAHQLKDQGLVSDEVQEALLAHGREAETFLSALEENYPRYFELKYRPFAPSLASVRRGLPANGSALLSYHTGQAGMTIFVLKPSHLVAKQVSLSGAGPATSFPLVAEDWFTWPKAAEEMGLREVARLRSSMVYGKRDVFCHYARLLHQILIEPVSQEIDGFELIVVPDGNLAFLPFEALLTADADAESGWDLPYLVKTFEISYVLASGLLDDGPRHPWRLDHPRGIAFAPVFGPEPGGPSRPGGKRAIKPSPKIQPLPFTQKEVAALDQLYAEAGGHLEVWAGKGANKEAFLEALGNGKTIHLATHAVIDETYPALSRLLFARSDAGKLGNELYLGEVFALDLDAELVVLSACETGRGQIANGEGVLGFVRGFHFAGAKRMVVSLWQVSDESTGVFMVDFYRALLAGSTPKAALRSAKLKGIAGHWPPYAWAGFVLTGGTQ